MTLEITEVLLGRTVNTGNYENVRFDLTAKVRPGQAWQDVYNALAQEVADLEQQMRNPDVPQRCK